MRYHSNYCNQCNINPNTAYRYSSWNQCEQSSCSQECPCNQPSCPQECSCNQPSCPQERPCAQSKPSNYCCYYPPFIPPHRPPHKPCPSCPSYPPTQPGGYTDFEALDSYDLYVFQAATAGLTGVTYEPIAVRTQIVNGTNYNFIARATTTTNPPTSYYVMISVYQAPNGGAITLGDIQPINL